MKTVTGPAHTVANTWDATRDALLSKENKVGTTVVSRYEYGVNAIGQRSTLAASGSAFSAARNIGWSYNARGEVTSADHSDTEQSRFYQYDAIGNRMKSRARTAADNGGSLTEYEVNPLNQYGSTTTSSYEIVNGFATSSMDWSPSAHDADGNRIGNHDFPAMIWDAENRLLEVGSAGLSIAFYRYDPFGRRISKRALGNTTYFVYDGWNPIGEYSSPNPSSPISHVRSNLFGQDLSGGMQGAGGVGGLLSTTDHGVSPAESFHATYDGNGNVSEYLDGSGAVAAHFEYDPFGQVTASTDSANRFRIRFSTKWQDFESGLNYYGYRYYDPIQGRWLSRDPIGEHGGYNVYGFIANEAISTVDLFGLEKSDNFWDWKPPAPRPPGFFQPPPGNVPAGELSEGDIDSLQDVVDDLNDVRDSQGRPCFKATLDRGAKTTDEMYDSVKNNDETYLLAHGGRDTGNKLTTVHGVNSATYSSGLRNVATERGNNISFYSCNQDKNGRRPKDPDGKDHDWNDEMSFPILNKARELREDLKNKKNNPPKECPCPESISVINGHR